MDFKDIDMNTQKGSKNGDVEMRCIMVNVGSSVLEVDSH